MSKRLKGYLTVLALLVSSSVVWAQSSPSIIDSSTIDRAFSYNNGSKIDRAPDGTLMTIWSTDSGDPYNDTVYTAIYDPGLEQWGAPQPIGLGTTRYTTPAIFADGNNVFHAVWSDLYAVQYARYDGGTWSAPDSVVKNAPWNALKSNKNSIAVAGDGEIFISWSTYRHTGSVNEWYFVSHSTDSGATWSDPDTLDKDWGTGNSIGFNAFPSLEAGPGNIIGATSTQKDPSVGTYRQQYLQEWDGTSWSDPELITTFHEICGDVTQSRLAYDSQGTRHVVFYADETDCVTLGNEASDNQVYYTYKEQGGEWSDPIAITATPDGDVSYCDIGVGPDGDLYAQVVMDDADGLRQIFHMRSVDGVHWTAPEQLSTSAATLPLRGASTGAHPGPLGADVVWVEPNPDPFGEYLLVYGRSTPVAQAAVITSIEDEPGDQGGWVKVHFDKSDWDTGSLLSKSLTAEGTELYTVEMDDGSGWTAVNSTVAYGSASYAVLAHITKDSSAAGTGMVSFRVIAGMDEGTFDSDVAMGYSVDNLAPAVPAGLVASVTEENTVALSWQSPVDEDFDGFRVYRSLVADFDPTGTDPLAETIATTITDVEVVAGETYYYRVSAVDVHANESDYSEDVSATIEVLSVDGSAGIPKEFALGQNYPNPFNPATTISFQLPQAAFVNLSIYNVTGQLVETMVSEQKEAGFYSITWDVVQSGIGSGVYFYRIQAGEFSAVRKSVVIK